MATVAHPQQAQQDEVNPLTEGLERLPVHPTTLVIFGATGDLAKRKLLPRLYNLAHAGDLRRQRLRASEGAAHRMLLEKPFVSALESALSLNRELLSVFDERQIFRIDHYLGKETVQNLLVLRFANGIFEPLWNRSYVDC